MNIRRFASAFLGIVLLSASSVLVGCKEEIDESNFAIKDKPTAADFITDNANFSLAKELLTRVKLGKRAQDATGEDTRSSILQALSARGNYTVFLPTNQAVQTYLDSVGAASIAELNDVLAVLIAQSCIIDNKNTKAYETVDFSDGYFKLPTLNDRILSRKEVTDSLGVAWEINGTSKIIDNDNEVSNGYIHVVDKVIAPSVMTVNKLIASAGNMKVFDHLLKITGLDSMLITERDESYYDPERPEIFEKKGNKYEFIAERYLGNTVFAESDDVYNAAFGLNVETDENGNITNGDDYVAKLADMVQKQGVYGTNAVGDYKNPSNAINRYVAYHILDCKVPYDMLVHHMNEFNYKFENAKSPQTKSIPTNVWDFYVTLGKPANLLKVTQVGDMGDISADYRKIFLNRISYYKNGVTEDYTEKGYHPDYRGIEVLRSNGEYDNNAVNGYYYPITEILYCDTTYRQELIKERIRFDITTVLPELMSNNVRGGSYTRFENGYFKNITRESTETELLYLMMQGAASWRDYQGDEFMVTGPYDFTFQLPPVPYSGIYEIRMGVSHNPQRGMCQIYFGEDPDALLPAGLPYDMRQNPAPENPTIPWFEDIPDDDSYNRENDKNLRNQGYMKGPQYMTVCDGKATTPFRNAAPTGNNKVIRRIVTTAKMDVGKTYYLRFKTALRNRNSELFLDYFEYVSPLVYNGTEPEDIW